MTTILLVEDAHDLAQVIIRELEANSYRTLHAGDGLTALELHAKVQPELVILDWMLPKLSGLEVLRRLRGGNRSRGRPRTGRRRLSHEAL
jgi:DNA-binding response OmpR family regulator